MVVVMVLAGTPQQPVVLARHREVVAVVAPLGRLRLERVIRLLKAHNKAIAAALDMLLLGWLESVVVVVEAI